MKKLLAVALVAVGSLSGCAVYPVAPGHVSVGVGAAYPAPVYRPHYYGYGYRPYWGGPYYRRW